eukprot:TRINITY_DN6552_c0_g2_i9.p1 TRINITY_DN6552_c0_g2~~TRINITY_DN6552_c0_g2_i9.p1  ORF type:complete len:457 (-),score=98.22 TRINITY_DN6552_c0_g2_i9:35-1405(-)
MGKRNFKEMFLQQAWFALWCYPAALFNTLMKFFEKKIALQFRTDLTTFLHSHYFKNNTFYEMKRDSSLDCLDQRITADVEQFCKTLTFVYGHILKPVLDALFLSHSLGKLMGFRQLCLFFLYFFGMNKLLSAVKPNFSRLVSEKQRLEGFYRADHTRIIQSAEEIAFVGGSQREFEIANRSYTELDQQESKSLLQHFWTDLLDNYVMKYGGTMMAYSAIIPSVFINWKNMNSQQATQHYITSTTMLLSLGNALKDILLSYKEVAVLEGLTDRVHQLYAELMRVDQKHKAQELGKKDGKNKGTVIRREETDYIELKDCDIFTPDGLTHLVKKLSMRIEPGHHLLLEGRNGTGKSSLFRTMGELWPLRDGVLELPLKSEIYFISQNSYMCPGTLRDQITYPEHVARSTPDLDKKLAQLLSMVKLNDLLDRFSLDSVAKWQSILSGGEKQRIVIARTLR